MSADLRNKTALVTGASSGIGEAVARELARRGCNLVLLARRRDRLDALAAELSSPQDGRTPRIVTVEADVTRDGDVERAVEQAHQSLGPIDIVVANAGIGVIGPLMKLGLDDHRRQLETNVFGVLRTFIATRDDLAAQRGCLAVIGSVNGYVPIPTSGPYAMSKFAVRAFCDCLRMEVHAQGIAVTHIIPGFIATDIRRIDNQGIHHSERKDPAPPWLQMPVREAAEEIADAIALREPERILTRHGKLALFVQQYLPGTLAALFTRAGIQARKR